MQAVRKIWIAAGGGTMLWQGEPLTPEDHEGIAERSDGSALEFALWCRTVRQATIVPRG